MVKRHIISFALFIVFISSVIFYAFSGGITGRTKKNGTGCTCHGSQNANVSVIIAGPTTLETNEVSAYTVTIFGGPLSKAGTNIAASAGTLQTIPDQGLQLIGDELTHTQPKSPVGGFVTFTFGYVAPSTPGNVTLYANGNSVNNSGSSSGDQWNFATNLDITVTLATDVEDEGRVTEYSLKQNYPNPFNPSTNISYTLKESGDVSLKVYDVSGKEVMVLENGFKEAGSYNVHFNAGSLSAGVYYYRLISGDFSETKKMVLTK